MDVHEYLDRLRIREAGSRSPAVLAHLQRQHLWTIPFENLDISLGRVIELDLAAMYDKVVRRGRGGFCYELNGLFAWALEELGFRVSRLSGRVFHGGRPGPAFDHLLLLVELDEAWIADVGFGDSFVDPLPLDDRGTVHVQHGQRYRLEASGDGWILWRGVHDGVWEPQYSFTVVPHQLGDFAVMCRYHQTSPESPFTGRTVCSLATPSGRRTLTNNRFIITDGSRREEREIVSPDEYRELLATFFGILLPEGTDVRRLMGLH